MENGEGWGTEGKKQGITGHFGKRRCSSGFNVARYPGYVVRGEGSAGPREALKDLSASIDFGSGYREQSTQLLGSAFPCFIASMIELKSQSFYD